MLLKPSAALSRWNSASTRRSCASLETAGARPVSRAKMETHMNRFPKPPKGVVRITEYEVDPRDVEDMLRGKPRRRPRSPVNVKHHDLSGEALKKFLRRIGVPEPDHE